MAATGERQRVRDEVIRLVHRVADVPQLAREVTRILRRAVPFDGTCLLTMDPATILPTGDVVENALSPSAALRLTEIELREPDVNKFTYLARGPLPAAGLAEATAGDLDRSTRHRELRRPSGFDDELRVVLTGATGTWGALTLLREARRPRFTHAESGLMASLAGPLADGVRRATLLGGAADDDAGPGLLVLAPDYSLATANQAGLRWPDELGAETGGQLPVALRGVAVRAREIAQGERTDGTGAWRGPGPGRADGPSCRDRCWATGRMPRSPCSSRRRAWPNSPRSSPTRTVSRTASAGSPSWWRRGTPRT